MIKSATTPWNRCRPRNMRSHQAKLHISKGLFCTKKPPKAEDCDNENTHHQRSYCKNVQQFLFSDDSNQKFIFLNQWMTKPTSDQEHLVLSSIYSFFVYITISKRLFWQLAIDSCKLLSRSGAATPPTYSVGWQVVVSCLFFFISAVRGNCFFLGSFQMY